MKTKKENKEIKLLIAKVPNEIAVMNKNSDPILEKLMCAD